MKRNFLTLLDLSRDELFHLLGRSAELKRFQKQGNSFRPLEGKSFALLFEKHSTRTRLSFEVGISQLGGQAVYLSAEQTQLARGEPVKDTARVMGRYLDGIIIRNDRHEVQEEFARFAGVPVINALSSLHHPCQVFADLFTLREAGLELRTMKLAYVGDPNNVFNSWVNAAALTGCELALASPRGFEPDRKVIKLAKQKGALKLTLSHKPREAVKGADVIYTDVWVSMGQEQAAAKKRAAFKGFQVDEKLVRASGKKTLVLHCLPAHRGEEIAEDVLESRAELIFTQAENRLHSQKAILEFVVSGKER